MRCVVWLLVLRCIAQTGYGPGDGVDDVLSRAASLTTNLRVLSVASFERVGSGRRAGLTLAGGEIVQSFRLGSETGLGGLDGFGRVADLRFVNADATPATLFRAEYTYDASGSRVSSRLTQWPVASQQQENVRSQLNAYDGLQRLIGTEVGELDFDQGGSPFIVPASLVRSDVWRLDLLGNWVGEGTYAGRSSFGDLDGFGTPWALPWADEYDDELDVTHGVDERNRLAGIVRADESTNIDDDHEPVYDGAGNLVFDGDSWYQYDAWNRLVQVNEAWRDTQEPFDVLVGDLVKHHSYDGLGRLVRTQSPVLGPTAVAAGRGSAGYPGVGSDSQRYCQWPGDAASGPDDGVSAQRGRCFGNPSSAVAQIAHQPRSAMLRCQGV